MLRALLLVLGAAAPAPGAAPFRVLWDSWFPTECRQFGDKTTAEDFAKFGITANRALDPGIPAVKPQQPVVNGTGTAGDAIILFYENFGLYPAIGSHAGNFSGTAMYECDPAQIVPNEPTWCNGGLPQLANLSAHASKLRSDIASAIPDPAWAGVAFIDYESWQPVWDWNDNCCPAYQAASIALVRQRHPSWSQPEVEAQARLELEAGALEFLMHTITVVRAERPHTQWSIDGYPGCGDSMDDYSGLLTEGRCPATATAGNDKIAPLLAIQDTLTPMPYLLSLNSSFNTVYLQAVMREAARLAPTKPVWVYSWYEYMLQGAPTVPDKPSCKHSPNGDYAPTCLLTRENLDVMLRVPKEMGAAGVVIWGGGADQSSAALCSSFREYFMSTLGPAIAAVTGGEAPSPSPPPAPAPHYTPRLIMPRMSPSEAYYPRMYKVSGPAFLHIPNTTILLLATMDFADNVLFTRSSDLGETWSNATRMMPSCHWVVHGSIHCDWGAPQIGFDALTDTVFLLVGNSTGVPAGTGCDQGAGAVTEENGAWLRTSTDRGLSWSTATKVAPPASPTHCVAPVMGNGVQIGAGRQHAGRMLFPLVHDSFNGAIVLLSDTAGRTWNYSHSENLIRPGIDESQIAPLANGSLMIISRNCIGVDDNASLTACHFMDAERRELAEQLGLSHADPKNAPRVAGDRFTWSVSNDGGDSWSVPRHHPDLLTPGCKGSIISYKGPSDSAAAVYFSGPYSTTQRWNLTVMASDDNGESFTRSLQIVPPGRPAGPGSPYPSPGTGYSQLQCGLPLPLDCAVAFDDGQEFNYQPPYCNISWVRFASSDVKARQ